MTRYGAMFGPDVTFLGVDRCDLDDLGSFAAADVVSVGAPFDGGTSHRPGTRFGPQAIRSTDYLPHDVTFAPATPLLAGRHHSSSHQSISEGTTA